MVKGRWNKEEKESYQVARTQFGRSWVRIAEYVKTRSATQCRSHGQKSDHKLIAREMKMTQTQYYDPRCFELVDPETSYSDDVDKYFDFSESTTADNTPKQNFFDATEDFTEEARLKIEMKDFEFYQN